MTATAAPRASGQTLRAYCVHAHDEAPPHPHRVEADGFVDAALTFLERWRPSADGELSVEVEDQATGERHCFTLDPASGDVEPCA